MTPERHVVVEPSVLYVGTPAYLIVTENADGSANLAPASSYWALGRMLVLGIEVDGQTATNLLERPDLTVNFPSADAWRSLVRLSTLTGRDPGPDAKQRRYRFEPEKFVAAGLTPQAADLVRPPRVLECRLQFEARVRRATPGIDGSYLMVEAEVLRVHADPAILDSSGEHIDPTVWNPIIYAFRHFFERGAEVGWLASSPTAPNPPIVD